MRHIWTEEEEQTLRDLWATPGLLKQQMEQLPGFTFTGIQQKAVRMKLGLKVKVKSLTYERIKVLMEDKEARTSEQIASAVAASVPRVNVLMREAIDRGEFHLAPYIPRPSNKAPMKVYRIGQGRSAVAPRTMTTAERARKHRQTADPIEYSFLRKKYALNRKIKLGKVRRDPVMDAFYGRASA